MMGSVVCVSIYYNKPKSLNVEIGESTLIYRVLESLPSQFDVMKTSYNTQKAEWTVDEMIAIVTQEEDYIKKVNHTVLILLHLFQLQVQLQVLNL